MMKRTIPYIIISMMAFRAFAQELSIGSLYVTSTDEEKLLGDGNDKWANRLPVICDMISFEQPDIMGLQSLTATQLSAIIYRVRTTHTAAGNILYNKSALTLLDNGTVDDMPEGSTCSWAWLQKEERSFYVFNVCLPDDASAANLSTTSLLNAITEVNAEGLPCFIVGYLGTNETQQPYRRLTARYPDCYAKAAVVSAEYGTRNNFDLADNHGNERFDFVLAPKTATVKAYGQLQYGYYTQESGGSYKRRLPSAHFPIVAKVTLP